MRVSINDVEVTPQAIDIYAAVGFATSYQHDISVTASATTTSIKVDLYAEVRCSSSVKLAWYLPF